MTQPLKVIVVGAGFAGLAAAIECKLRKMDVVLIEKYTNSNSFGDIIDFFSNAGRTFKSWDNGSVARKLDERGVTKAKAFQLHTADGHHFHNDPWFLTPYHEGTQFAGHRGDMWQIILDYAVSIGVEYRFGRGVEQYLETESTAGVRLAGGEEIWGNCVIAADGPKSLAREQVLKIPDDKINSGYAIYRAFFKATPEVRNNPLLKDFVLENEDTVKVWLGEDCHMIGYGWNGGEDICWVMTHKDDHDIAESETWSFPGDKNEALKFISAFSDECKALIEATPAQQITDYKLIWRDSPPTWRSANGLSIVIGDACHCHLPTSAQGGSQAVEDSQVIAVCLDRANGDVKLALQVAERIRFNRSKVVQLWGRVLRDSWHKESDTSVHAEGNGEVRRLWIIDLDVAAHAEKHFDHLAQDVKNGRPGTLEELSLPPGGTFGLGGI